MANTNLTQPEQVVHSSATHFITAGGGVALRLYRGEVSSWAPSNLLRDDGSAGLPVRGSVGFVATGLADHEDQAGS